VEPIDLTKLLLSLIQEYNFIAEAEKIKIDVHIAEKIMIQGNIQGLTRVFSNLFDNAIKYNTINGRIEVISTISENDFTLKIGNTGPGVNSFEVDKVFDQFFRAEKSRSVQHGGYGLGLAIVKRIIELHKGIIKFESRPGVWTQVIIVLPVSL
jgi:signal transduction histidine kinase